MLAYKKTEDLLEESLDAGDDTRLAGGNGRGSGGGLEVEEALEGGDDRGDEVGRVLAGEETLEDLVERDANLGEGVARDTGREDVEEADAVGGNAVVGEELVDRGDELTGNVVRQA